MENLSKGQKWALAAFVVSAVSLIPTFFLEGDARTVAYILIGLGFAAFAVIQSGDRGKAKNQ